jgi:hypothetical protein
MSFNAVKIETNCELTVVFKVPRHASEVDMHQNE